MKPSSLKIRRAVCAKCKKMKFCFVGQSDFCGNCLDEYCDLIWRASDLRARELIVGFLSDMNDACEDGVETLGFSEALQKAQERANNSTQVDTARKVCEERRKAEIAATLAMFKTLCELAPAGAKEAATRAFQKTYSNRYLEELLKPLEKALLE